jgi:hypothetical protein
VLNDASFLVVGLLYQKAVVGDRRGVGLRLGGEGAGEDQECYRSTEYD